MLIDECASGRFPHLDFDFLQPDKIRDANGRLANDPEYCPRTLYVPDSFLKEQTPGLQFRYVFLNGTSYGWLFSF